jgi:uncharacterized protein YaeQ
LHRASKLASRVVVYTHRDARQLLAQLSGEKIHRASEIPVRAFDRLRIEEIAAAVDRRTSMAMSVTDGELFITMHDRTFTLPLHEHRIE